MIGHSTSRPAPGPITWGTVRYEDIHFACATEEEILLTWAAFNGPEHKDADKPCARCNRPLKETPDP